MNYTSGLKMDEHLLYSSISTLRNIIYDIEKKMKEKHQLMQEVKNDFLSLQRQHKDIKVILDKLESKEKG